MHLEDGDAPLVQGACRIVGARADRLEKRYVLVIPIGRGKCVGLRAAVGMFGRGSGRAGPLLWSWRGLVRRAVDLVREVVRVVGELDGCLFGPPREA